MRALSILAAAAALICHAAQAAAPAYPIEGIVNASDYSGGPFSPNSVLSIFGTDLSWGTASATVTNTQGAVYLPEILGGVQVLVQSSRAALFYVSPTQINFLMPKDLDPGPVTVQVIRQGVAGPQRIVTLLSAAPALFSLPLPWPEGFAIAQHSHDNARWPEYSLVAPESPTSPGKVIMLYATGLGPYDGGTVNRGEIPQIPYALLNSSELKVWLNGEQLDASYVLWAGVSPGCAGLYQVNIRLPETAADSPEIRVSVNGQFSRAGLRLALSTAAEQPADALPRI